MQKSLCNFPITTGARQGFFLCVVVGVVATIWQLWHSSFMVIHLVVSCLLRKKQNGDGIIKETFHLLFCFVLFFFYLVVLVCIFRRYPTAGAIQMCLCPSFDWANLVDSRWWCLTSSFAYLVLFLPDLNRPRISKIQFKGRYFMLRVRDKSVSHFYTHTYSHYLLSISSSFFFQHIFLFFLSYSSLLP